MPRLRMLVLGFITAILCGSILAANTQPTIQSLNKMPLAFTKNMGQWDDRVLFRANAGGATMWFTKEGVTYQFTRRIDTRSGAVSAPGVGQNRFGFDSSGIGPADRFNNEPDSIDQLVLTAKFVGANPNPEVVAESQLEYKCNYFIGNDPTKWHTDVPNYEAITLKDIYPGIDLKYSGDGNGQAAYEFIVAQGADIAQIKVAYEGAEETSIDADGRMIVRTKWGDMIAAIKSPTNGILSGTGSFSQLSEETIGFEADRSTRLTTGGSSRQALGTLAVGLVYSTYLGGGGTDLGHGIAVDGSGNAYVTGYTDSPNFPTQNPYQLNQGGEDVFVTKLSSTGNSLIYSTYLGGESDDVGVGIAIDGSGNAYLTGLTRSSDFPTLNPYQTYQGGYDAFVTKLSSTGNSLIYSTYLGGGDYDAGNGIAVDGSGYAYVTGYTDSYNFPTLNPYQTDQGGGDAFVTKLSNSGNSLIYSTYLGGGSHDGGDYDVGYGIAVDGSGRAYVTGVTESSNFPTLNPYQTYQRGGDAFVTKLSSTGNSLIYSTYLGGGSGDAGYGIAVDGSVNAYVTGETGSSDFPTLNPYQTYQGGYDAFVTELSSTGNSLIYSTYLGGGGRDVGNGIAVDGSGNAYVTGWTTFSDFPTVNPYQTYQGVYDAFVTKLSSIGNSLIYSTYLGGGSWEFGQGIAVDGSGNAYVTGGTNSSNFPTLSPYQTYQGGEDVFVTKLSGECQEIVPVVLVHGWSENPNIWQTMKGWLQQDGHQYVWSVDLEECGTQDENGFKTDPAKMYRGNAAILADFIDNSIAALPASVRECVSSVDIVAHSMGGLVARRYISRKSSDPWAPRSVRNLIMLGTPNKGSALANGWPFSQWKCPTGPAWEELQPKWMKEFNAKFPDNSGTAYCAAWGSAGLLYIPPFTFQPNYSCNWGLGGLLAYPNDGVVAKSSVVGEMNNGSYRYPNDYGSFLCHNELYADHDLYTSVVKPILQGSPPKTKPLAPDTTEGTPPQFCLETEGSVAAGGEKTGSFVVEANTNISVYLFASDSDATFALSTPSGAVLDSLSTNTDSSVVYISSNDGIMGFHISSAEAGTWQWHAGARNAPSGDVEFTILATCSNSIVVDGYQSHDYLTQADTLVLRVGVKDGGMGVAGLTVTAIPIWNDGDTASALTLSDDGMHGDDAAGDGLYGIRLSNLNSGVVEYRTSVTGTTAAGQINRLLSFSAYVMGYLCGDANGDAAVDISDAVYLIAYIFSGGQAPSPLLAGDANCDSTVDISDAVYLIAYIFSGGAAPCAACK